MWMTRNSCAKIKEKDFVVFFSGKLKNFLTSSSSFAFLRRIFMWHDFNAFLMDGWGEGMNELYTVINFRSLFSENVKTTRDFKGFIFKVFCFACLRRKKIGEKTWNKFNINLSYSKCQKERKRFRHLPTAEFDLRWQISKRVHSS